ncbi:S-4TM family putative pore-forming effector [Micrococcus aloeverae]|nr:S-4TM family putative pore-forming effector [Micrococcus aloeverae]
MSYSPPRSTDIAEAQNSDANLRLLVTQRRLYSCAKTWSMVRGIGVGVVAIAAPILTGVVPQAAVAVAAVAAVWFALNRLFFSFLERYFATRGATAQEQFDTSIFGMPTIAVRNPRLMPEEIRRLTGDRVRRKKAYSDENLRNWYPIRTDVDGTLAIAISQRANLAYAQTLLGRNAALWLVLLIVWAVIAVFIGVARSFDLLTFLLVVAVPTLPPLLDAVDEALRVRAAGKERRALANQIEDAITTASETPILPEQLLAWQAQLFALRRDSPLVPDWLYWLLRPRTEDEMNDGAKTIADGVRGRKEQEQ